MKKFFTQTKVGRFLAGFTRGMIRTVPIGNGIMDGVENVKALKELKAGKINKLPHSWTAILVELIGCLVIIIAWRHGLITQELMMKLLNVLFNFFDPTVALILF